MLFYVLKSAIVVSAVAACLFALKKVRND